MKQENKNNNNEDKKKFLIILIILFFIIILSNNIINILSQKKLKRKSTSPVNESESYMQDVTLERWENRKKIEVLFIKKLKLKE